MKCKIDIALLRMSIHDSCNELFLDRQMRERAYKIISSTIEDIIMMYADYVEEDWIPVEERLPEEDVDVLISYRYKEGEGDTSHSHIDITSYGDVYFGGNKLDVPKRWREPFEYFDSNYEVIAWMPLPMPYGKEQEHERRKI